MRLSTIGIFSAAQNLTRVIIKHLRYVWFFFNKSLMFEEKHSQTLQAHFTYIQASNWLSLSALLCERESICYKVWNEIVGKILMHVKLCSSFILNESGSIKIILIIDLLLLEMNECFSINLFVQKNQFKKIKEICHFKKFNRLQLKFLRFLLRKLG